MEPQLHSTMRIVAILVATITAEIKIIRTVMMIIIITIRTLVHMELLATWVKEVPRCLANGATSAVEEEEKHLAVGNGGLRGT